MAIIRVPKSKKIKLEEREIDCIFIGHAKHSKTYRFMVIEPNALIMVNTIIESIDAISYENRFFSIPKPNDLTPNTMSLGNGQEQRDMVEIRRGGLERRNPSGWIYLSTQ